MCVEFSLYIFSISISSLVHTCICMHDVRLKGLASWHKDHPYIVYRELACLMISLSLYMYETNNNFIF